MEDVDAKWDSECPPILLIFESRAAGIDVRRNGLLSDKTSVGLGTASVQLFSASK